MLGNLLTVRVIPPPLKISLITTTTIIIANMPGLGSFTYGKPFGK